MSGVFELLGILLASYTAYAMWTGTVFAKQGPWGRSFLRDDERSRHWSMIVIYIALSLAPVFYF